MEISTDLKIGRRVFYTGDMANESKCGTIHSIKPATQWGSEQYRIIFDDKSETFVGAVNFEPGPGRRFMTELEWRVSRILKMEEMFIENIKLFEKS